MDIELKPVFGLEIHLELNTKTKAFSNTLIKTNDEPNKFLTPTDLGYPGTKPTVNKRMVEYTYYLAKSLKMSIDKRIVFDRKNYFYPDLAKGFQITQFFNPFGRNGVFSLVLKNGEFKEIGISEIHMEEDTAKQIRENEAVKFDFNRAGIPLIEIVTDHTSLESVEDVLNFVSQFRELVFLLGISDAKLENGSMRIDVNVSLKEINTSEYRNRVEIKNLNSLNNIKKSLEFEINQQTKTYLNGLQVNQVTKFWNEEENKLIIGRVKEDSNDYRYITETNIMPIFLNEEIINEWDNNFNKKDIAYNFRQKMINIGFNEIDVDLILSYPILYSKIMIILLENDSKNLKKYFNFIFVRLQGILNLYNLFIYDLPITINHIVDFVSLLEEGKINNDSFKKEIIKIIEKKFDTNEITKLISELKNISFLTEEEVNKMVHQIIKNNSSQYEKLLSNPNKLSSFLIGQIMKSSNGRVNSLIVNKVVNKIINE